MPRILIVEDSASTRAFVRAILEGAEFSRRHGGCEVVEATCGFDAMRLLPRDPYDLIVTDINMTDINGLELIRFIRRSAHYRKTPLMVISTLRAEHDAERGLALGANIYLAKPFSPEQFLESCEKLLSSSGGRSSRPPSGGHRTP